MTQSFEYDTHGRLTATALGAGLTTPPLRRTSYAYDDEGAVTITDAAGVLSKIFFDRLLAYAIQ